MSIILQVNNLKKTYFLKNQQIEILKGIDLELSKGETMAVIGRSGSGKSTFLSMVSGIDMPTSGDILFEGTSILSISEDERTKLRTKKIGIIFQQFHLLNHLSALENVMIALDIAGHSGAREKATEALHAVGLGHRLNHFPSELSGGEKQRVAIARSLGLGPDLLLADEPSGSLDEGTGDEVMDLLFKLVKDNNMGLILVTHSEQLADRCQKKMLLENGKLRQVSN